MRKLCMAIAFISATIANVHADPPPGYYSAAAGKAGDSLKSALHSIIDDHKVLPYTVPGNKDLHDGENVDVREALVYTDSACPDTHPQCGMVRLLYLDDTRSVDQANRGKGTSDSWDREHVWPRSRGFPKKSQIGYTDLHHLRPADRNINGKRSNYGFDMGGKVVLDKLADGSEVPTMAKIDTTNGSFEPPDHAKGQVARMIFYMAVRYEEGDNGPDEQMPDLVLRDENKKIKEPWIGDLCALVEWNNRFAPTEFERRRNDRVMELQGNRNPFIDEPTWANLIWGPHCQ